MVLVGRVVNNKSDFYVGLSLLKGSRQLWKQTMSPGVGLEILWAPDSRAFSVSSSHQAPNGWFDTQVFVIDPDGFVQEVDVTTPVLQAFGDPVECAWPEPPNVGAVRWLGSSRKILIAAEIVRHRVCDSYGTFHAYEVSLPYPEIVGTLDQLQAKQLYRKDLGDNLTKAPDACILHPKTCWLPSNHPTGATHYRQSSFPKSP